MLNLEALKNLDSNGTFDVHVLEKTIEEVKLTSFKNLYQFQRELTGVRRFNLKMSDLVLMTNLNKKTRMYPKKYVGSVDGDFIHKRKRLLYKRSSFFNKELSIFDVASNANIFYYTYLVFVDGKFMDTINIMTKEDKTLVIFDIADTMNQTGIPKDYFKKLVEKNADITVYFMPNCTYGIYKTDRNLLLQNQNHLSLKRFDLVNHLDTDPHYITFVNDNDFLFSSVITDTTNSKDMLRFHNNTAQPTTNKYVHLNIFGFRNLRDQLDVPGSEKFFKIPIENMPLPVENIMPFRNLPDGTKVFAHDVTLELFYPNVYQVHGNEEGDNLTFYIFYSEDNEGVPIRFKNELELYHSLMGDDLSPYVNNTIPDAAKNYQPAEYIYSISDYNASEDFPDHTLYKLKKFSDWIDREPELMKIYYQYMLTTANGYYIDLKDVDLASKSRWNNHQEIDTVLDQETFTEERYVFILRNEYGKNFQQLRFYIDGNAYTPDKKWQEELYEIYYIPASLIEEDSIIEIERFAPLDFMRTVTFNTIDQNQSFSITTAPVARNDIFLVDRETKAFIDPSKYTISYFNEDGIKVNLGKDSFKPIPGGVFVLNITDNSLVGKVIQVHAQRNTYSMEFEVTEPDELGSGFIFDEHVNPDIRNFRIFRNGRLLSQTLYTIEPATVYGGQTLIIPRVLKDVGDKYIIDYTPNRYKVVYEQATIPDSGIVNLVGKVSKPMDLKWYDIYLNGKRLTKNDVDFLSPYLLGIKNVESLKNLLIVERDKDPDIFNPVYGAKSLTDMLWETVPEFQDSLTASRPIIPDIEPDVVSEIITEKSLRLKKFFDLVIKQFDFINPDVMQIEDPDKEQFDDLFQGNVFPINPDMDYEPRSFVMKIYGDPKE